MSKQDEHSSWFSRIAHFLHLEPKNKADLIGLLRDAEDRKLIDAETLLMIEGVFQFSQLKVRDIMHPKHQMVCIENDESLMSMIEKITESGHSRFPVIENKSDIIGILHAKDLLRYFKRPDEPIDLTDILREPTFVPESKRLDLLLSDFRNNRNHMAIVVDEYGAVVGFITLENLIEQIIGEIEDEFDIDEESNIKAHGAGHYIIKAHAPIEEFNEHLHAQFSDDQYDTVGGIVIASFGYLPQRGESITINHFEFRIIQADARRIKLIECIDLRSETMANDTEMNK